MVADSTYAAAPFFASKLCISLPFTLLLLLSLSLRCCLLNLLNDCMAIICMLFGFRNWTAYHECYSIPRIDCLVRFYGWHEPGKASSIRCVIYFTCRLFQSWNWNLCDKFLDWKCFVCDVTIPCHRLSLTFSRKFQFETNIYWISA